MANSAPIGSWTWHCRKDHLVEDIEALGGTNLTKPQCKFILRLHAKFGGGNAGYAKLQDYLYEHRRGIWANYLFTFRYELPKSLAAIVFSLVHDLKCSLCGNYTVRSSCVCKHCTDTDRKSARKERWRLRAEKSRLTSMKNWGVAHPARSPKVRAKFEKTMLKKWGVKSPAQHPTVKAKMAKSWEQVDKDKLREKRTRTNRKVYGTDSPMQNAQVVAKMKATWAAKSKEEVAGIVAGRNRTIAQVWGHHPSADPEVKARAKATHFARTGYEHNMQDPGHLEERKQRSLKKHGVVHPMQRQEVKDRTAATMLFKYGGMGRGSTLLKDKIESTNLERYGYPTATANPEIMDKCRATWLAKYGYEYPNQNPEQAAKGLRHSYNRIDIDIGEKSYTVQGNSEVIVLKMLVAKFGKVYTQFHSKYPKSNLGWTPDFYVPSKNIYVECKSSWTLVMPSAGMRNRSKAATSPNVRWVVVHNNKPVVLPKSWHKYPNTEFIWTKAYYESFTDTSYSEPFVANVAQWVGKSAQIHGNLVLDKARKIAIRFVPLYWATYAKGLCTR